MAPQVREEREDCIAVALAERTEELARVPLHRLAWQWEEVTSAMFLLLVVKKAACTRTSMALCTHGKGEVQRSIQN